MALDGASHSLVLRLLIIVSCSPFEHNTEVIVRDYCTKHKQFGTPNAFLRLMFIAVPLCDKYNGWCQFAGKMCAFMLSFWSQSEQAHSCVCSEKRAFGQTPPAMAPCIRSHRPCHIVNYAFHCSPQALFHNNASFPFLGRWVGGWRGLSVALHRCCCMLSAPTRPHFWVRTGTISGFSEVDIITSQITTALIPSKSNAKKTFWE